MRIAIFFLFISINALAMDINTLDNNVQRFITALRFDVRKNPELESGLFYDAAVKEEFLLEYEFVNKYEKWYRLDQEDGYQTRKELVELGAKISPGSLKACSLNKEKFSALCLEIIAKSFQEVLSSKKNIIPRVAVAEAHYPLYGKKFGIDIEYMDKLCDDKQDINFIEEPICPQKSIRPRKTIMGLCTWSEYADLDTDSAQQ